MQDTGKFRTNAKDQFYTNPRIAVQCVAMILHTIPFAQTYHWIEPSAGNGAFLHALPPNIDVTALDIEPKAERIVQQDFLTWTPVASQEQPFLVFGNPPFGRQSSLAKAFLKHSASAVGASVIAFILPKSFTKPSMTRAIPLHFHCKHSSDLPDNSFLLNGQPYDVPCVFQIWVKEDTERTLDQAEEPIGFTYVKATDPHHLVIRRVGVNAGKCFFPKEATFSPQSHYFIAFPTTTLVSAVHQHLNQHTFPSNTVGPRSVSKGEVNGVINEKTNL